MGLSGGQDLHACPVPTFRGRPRAHAWPKPCLTATTYTLAQLPRFDTDDERTLGEALFGRQDLRTHAPPARSRERSRTHARAKPCLAAHPRRMYPLPRVESDERTHGRSPSGRQDLHTLAPLHRFRRRSPTHAWAKPCLAGRPTALVRTQPPEQHTSRGRPSGMELPDYPVVVLTPVRRTRMGPHFCSPPGLFPYSYLVLLPAGSFSRTRTSFRFPLLCI
jgi:hypothetical protein